MEKIRAERNRTLTLTEQERILYKSQLMFPPVGKNIDLQDIINKTLCADLFTILDFLPKSFADLIIIDPPYNLSKDFNGYSFNKKSDTDYLDYLQTWFPAVVSCLKPNGSLYMCGDWKSTSALYEVMKDNLTVMNRITWQREKGRGALRNWKNGMEDIWFGVRNRKEYYFDVEAVKVRRRVIAPYKIDGQPKDWEATDEGNFRNTYPSNCWDDISIPYWSMPENTDHPTQKPEKLIAKLILASCPEGGIVFDPFLGSGTTSVTAKKLGRNYIGIEMNEEYALWSAKRLEQATENNTIQGYTNGVFWERNTLSLQKERAGTKHKNNTQLSIFQ